MATSGSTDFTLTRNEIIRDALYAINAIGIGENIAAEDLELATRTLNRMIKGWEANGINLWKKSTATVFLVKGRQEYKINKTSNGNDTGNATESYRETTLTADEAIGQSQFTVADTSVMTVGDSIGVVTDDNDISWGFISTIDSPTLVTGNTTLASNASSGNAVYFYTTQIDQPLTIYSVNRRGTTDDRDVPLNYLSYQQYFELPNKNSQAIPVSYNYDRQRDYAALRVWPTASDASANVLQITFSKKIQDFDSATDNPDIPQDWLEAITLNLAAKLAVFFGKNTGESFHNLKADADTAFNVVSTFDDEYGSLFLKPNYEGKYSR